MSERTYIYVCAGCNLLDETFRRDTLFCSPACRVREHRNGSLDTLRAFAAANDIHVSEILRAKAIERLCPDLVPRIMSGEIRRTDSADVQRQVSREFTKLVMRLARERQAAEVQT